MPVTTSEFTVALPKDKLWTMLNDLGSLGKCVPGCEEVQVLGPDDSKWKLKLSVGIISRRIEAKAKITERSPPDKMTVKIESVDGEITGMWTLQLADQGQSGTKVTFVADMTARGAFEWVVNQVIKTQMGKMINQFAECVSKTAMQP